jgi:hypothetical protein
VLILALLGVAACGGDDDGAGGSAASGSGGGGSTAASSGSGGSAPCQTEQTSSLPGVSVEFTTSDCNYTLAEAAAGISIEYQVLVEADIPNVLAQPSDDGGCGEPGPSGLILFEEVSGGGQRYCRCDVGLCPGPSGDLVTVPAGTYPATFAWHGRNWNGPSDTGAPEGAPFPPGDYTLTVRAVGAYGDPAAQTPFEVEGTFLIHLLP